MPLVQRTVLLAALTLALCLPARTAQADSLFALAQQRSTVRTFSVAGCGSTFSVPVTAPRGSTKIRALAPEVGEEIVTEDGEVFAHVSAIDRSAGRQIVFTVTGSDAACRPAGPDCASSQQGCPVTGASRPTEVVVAFTRRERVYVTGTGRGGARSYKPRVLPFGVRSAIVGLRWSGWGSATAVGHGRVEYNSCVPNCAQARPSYFPVRATLTRRRACNGFAQYLTLRFTYTTNARPPGLSTSYRESFGSVCQ